MSFRTVALNYRSERPGVPCEIDSMFVGVPELLVGTLLNEDQGPDRGFFLSRTVNQFQPFSYK